MDDHQFDGIAKLLGASIARRGALGVLAALGASGAIGIFGAAAKGKGKGKGRKNKGKKSGPKRACPAKAKPACAASACQAAICDYRRGKWSCRNACAGTSTPKCLGGQCVDACDEELGLTECGDQCCNPLVHSECCQGKCCDLGQRCEDGQCVKSCEGWEGLRGGRLEYSIVYEMRSPRRIDQAANAVADLECSYDAVERGVDCFAVDGIISGTHAMSLSYSDYSEQEEGSGSETFGPWGFPGLDIKLPGSEEDPSTFECSLPILVVAGTYRNSNGANRNTNFPIPYNVIDGWIDTERRPLPAKPGVLSGVNEFKRPEVVGDDGVSRFTWTFTPDGC